MLARNTLIGNNEFKWHFGAPLPPHRYHTVIIFEKSGDPPPLDHVIFGRSLSNPLSFRIGKVDPYGAKYPPPLTFGKNWSEVVGYLVISTDLDISDFEKIDLLGHGQ